MRIPTSKNDKGFTLIELLVVVVIIGILAAVAVPVFLNQRQKAGDSAAKSDLKNAATAQEAYLTSANTYGTTQAALEGEGFNKTTDVTFTVISATDLDYCMSAKGAPSDTVWYYDSADGGLLPEGTTCT